MAELRVGDPCPECGKPLRDASPSGIACADGHGYPYPSGTPEPRVVPDALDDGDAVSWTAGKETFCPVKFHGFEVGPVTATTRLRPRETAADAIARAKSVALAAWNEEYGAKLAGHLDRIREASGTAKGER